MKECDSFYLILLKKNSKCASCCALRYNSCWHRSREALIKWDVRKKIVWLLVQWLPKQLSYITQNTLAQNSKNHKEEEGTECSWTIIGHPMPTSIIVGPDAMNRPFACLGCFESWPKNNSTPFRQMGDWTARKQTVSSTCASQKSPVKSNSLLGPRSPRYADFRVSNQEAQP